MCQLKVKLSQLICSTRDVEWLGRLSELPRVLDVLRDVAFRVEDEGDLRAVGHLFADRVVMKVEADAGVGPQQTTRSFGKDVALLADRVLASAADWRGFRTKLTPVNPATCRIFGDLLLFRRTLDADRARA